MTFIYRGLRLRSVSAVLQVRGFYSSPENIFINAFRYSVMTDVPISSTFSSTLSRLDMRTSSVRRKSRMVFDVVSPIDFSDSLYVVN